MASELALCTFIADAGADNALKYEYKSAKKGRFIVTCKKTERDV